MLPHHPKLLLHCSLFLIAILRAHAEQVIFSEIMYHPGTDKPEFIEVWNMSATPLDTAKWKFTDGISYTFPDFNPASVQAHFLKAQERILISSTDELTTRAAYPSIPAGVRIYGPWAGLLDNAGEVVTLQDKNGVVVCTVAYGNGGRWPRSPDGTGHSLVLRNENNPVDDFHNWQASVLADGSPGRAEGAAPATAVRLSEVHFTANGHVDWVELQNTTAVAQTVDGLFLNADTAPANKIPISGAVPANGYASWALDFIADQNEITIFLTDSVGNVIGEAELKHAPGRDSLQAVYPAPVVAAPRWQVPLIRSTAEWYASATDTRDAANAPPISFFVVINEIMCDPISEHGNGEFIELHNIAVGGAVDLSGWKLRGGVDFDFPAGTIIPVGGYLVVAGDAAFIRANYPGVTVLGDWSGSLRNKGDLIRLLDASGNLADEVDYHIGGDWPDLAGGGGSSLELIHPYMDNNRASAWRDSDESSKTTFQTYSVSDIYRQLNPLGGVTDYKELHLHLAGDSHIALQNIQLKLNNAGANLLSNSAVMAPGNSAANGWLVQGTHYASYFDGGVFHLIGDGHGDNRANRAELDATAMTVNSNYTVSFEARWISGRPRLIVQTWDHSIGGSFLLPVPNNLGTPGAPNSRLASGPPPQVDSVVHSPAVPKTTEVVKVTARVTSFSPVTLVQVWHRASDLANNLTTNPWVATTMADDGTGGDVVGGDGIYTASITQHQVNNRIVQFYVRATSQNGATADQPKLGPSRPAMWMVDARTITGDLRRQRFVMSLYDRDALNTSSGEATKFQFKFPRLSNHYFNTTFIHNESDVYYLGEMRKSGSPWTRPDDNNLDRGKWKVPDDRTFRGRAKSTFDNDAANSTTRHHNRIIRYWLYVLGHPANENEFVNTLFNDRPLAIREDTEPVDNELVDRAFPDGNNGELMRSDDEWWFQDNWSRTQRNADWSYKGTDATIRYHTEWLARSRESRYDYSSLIEFFKTVSNGASTEAQLNRVLDPDLTLMMAAVRGYVYDWDSLTLNRGKNGYFYRKPTDGRWMFLHWDSDLAFQDANNIVVGGLAGWGTYISKPWTRRIFNHYLTEMLDLTSGPDGVRTLAWLDAEELSSASYTVSKSFYQNWFSARRGRIVTEINSAAGGVGNSYTAPFVVTTASGGTTAFDVVDIIGTAPSSVFTVAVDNHPETTLTWETQQRWKLTGLALSTGTNTFTVRGTDYLGNTVATAPFTITKTGNAPPLMQLAAEPASLNVALGETLSLDATASHDPDGGALTFAWSSTPNTGLTITQTVPSRIVARFTTPGVYAFTVTGTDPLGSVASLTREVTVFNTADFAPFGERRLGPLWTLQNIELRDNHAPSSWYSLEEKPGSLTIQVLNDSAKPLAYADYTHPTVLRLLPAPNNWSLQTDFNADAQQTGTFRAGLYVEMIEGGALVRYAFGIDGGNLITARRSVGGTFDIIPGSSTQFTGTNPVLRIQRIGDTLSFQRRVSGTWTGGALQTVAPGSAASKGGVFVATSTAQNVRFSFDYVLLGDPAHTSAIFSNLRLTELMYHPKSPDTVEFIELRNIGSTPLNLQGTRFDDGNPVDLFVFGDTPLSPGAYVVVTNNRDVLQGRVPQSNISGQWAGSLNNNGDRVVLRDPDGNAIHDFTYDEARPWPEAADGTGSSLEVLDVRGDYTDPANWRASAEFGGSPGFRGLGPDTDGDGVHDDDEAMFGTDPNDFSSLPRATATLDGANHAVISWPSVDGQSYRIEYTDVLGVPWQTLTTVIGGSGFSTFTDPTTPPPDQRFYRVAALP